MHVKTSWLVFCTFVKRKRSSKSYFEIIISRNFLWSTGTYKNCVTYPYTLRTSVREVVRRSLVETGWVSEIVQKDVRWPENQTWSWKTFQKDSGPPDRILVEVERGRRRPTYTTTGPREVFIDLESKLSDLIRRFRRDCFTVSDVPKLFSLNKRVQRSLTFRFESYGRHTHRSLPRGNPSVCRRKRDTSVPEKSHVHVPPSYSRSRRRMFLWLG